MKKFLYIFLVLAVLGAFVLIFAYINQDKLINRYIERQSSSVSFRTEFLEPSDEITLITVGTGSPLPSKRVQTCNAIFVNGHFFVFDAGEGASRKMELLRLPVNEIDAVFISHWHSDHYIDLPDLVNRSWQLGRDNPIEIYGPEPLDSVIAGLNMFLYPEIGFRRDHHGPELMNVDNALIQGNTVSVEQMTKTLVYEKDGIQIYAFLVDHLGVTPSLGYRLEYDGKSIVISGDTKKSDNLIRHAEGTDLLLHEAMQMDFVSRAADYQEELGNERNATIARRMMLYHSSSKDAAEVANEAGAKKLVLYHLTPSPENPISRRFYTLGLHDVYSGPIIIAKDGNIFRVE